MCLISVVFIFFSYFTYLHPVTAIDPLKYYIFQVGIFAIFDIICKICDNFCLFVRLSSSYVDVDYRVCVFTAETQRTQKSLHRINCIKGL